VLLKLSTALFSAIDARGLLHMATNHQYIQAELYMPHLFPIISPL